MGGRAGGRTGGGAGGRTGGRADGRAGGRPTITKNLKKNKKSQQITKHHWRRDTATFGSDSLIVGHFSVLDTDGGIRSRSGRVSTPVIKLGYPDPGGRFSRNYENKSYLKSMMWAKIIEVRWTPEFGTNSLLFLFPHRCTSAAGRFGPPNLTGLYVLCFRVVLINSSRPGAILEKKGENTAGKSDYNTLR